MRTALRHQSQDLEWSLMAVCKVWREVHLSRGCQGPNTRCMRAATEAMQWCCAIQLAITVHSARGPQVANLHGKPHRRALCSALPLRTSQRPLTGRSFRLVKFASVSSCRDSLWLASKAIGLLHIAPLFSHSNLVAGLCCASIVFGFACLWRLLETGVRRERCSSVEIVSRSQSLS